LPSETTSSSIVGFAFPTSPPILAFPFHSLPAGQPAIALGVTIWRASADRPWRTVCREKRVAVLLALFHHGSACLSAFAPDYGSPCRARFYLLARPRQCSLLSLDLATDLWTEKGKLGYCAGVSFIDCSRLCDGLSLVTSSAGTSVGSQLSLQLSCLCVIGFIASAILCPPI